MNDHITSEDDEQTPDKQAKKHHSKVLLIDDQVIIAEAVRRMLADQEDISFHYCSEPTKAIQVAAAFEPTVILQDLVMPDIDGLMLVKYFRANPATKDIPLIVLSVKEDPKIKAEAFAIGANDYAVKLPDKRELIARIRYHSSAYIHLLERNRAYEQLAESQRNLKRELSEAAEYVRSLLPDPLCDSIETSWRFIPSTQLGGDAFGYHWMDEDHFSVYLFDVCGHGVGAALLSISVMNVLRSQSLPHTDFFDPVAVLTSLNAHFPMEKHNNMFFTIWYGIYNKQTKRLTYSSGGHPPAVLITGSDPEHLQCKELTTPGLVIGGLHNAEFLSASCEVEDFNKLFLFSDGIYEINKPADGMLTLREFIDYLYDFARKTEASNDDLDNIIKFARSLQGKETFEDDVSIVELTFNK